jgi:UDP-N-acetylglucosamine diphosphorylase / glucose-1-phosphate thymidylyltransferase / UDP-N-acetylgalactosamine diphosphorylase / glucosamine-1-phosphate N-acetyltransferase / galactosamine-1-phosphate N-acetyltransferase
MEGFSFPILVVALNHLKSYSLYLEEAYLQKDFYPLTLNRTFSELRTGIFSIRDRWHLLASKQGIKLNFSTEESADLTISAQLIPKHNLDLETLFTKQSVDENDFFKINQLWELTTSNIEILLSDFYLIDSNQYLLDTPVKIMLTGKNPVFVHPSAQLDYCFINTENGPVLIDAKAQIMSGAMLRGPVYIGEHAVVKMGTTLYEGSNIGYRCVVGGEIKNSIFHANANKSHHGYIGDSYIGEWCNLGAGTSCSNLKNTAGKIKIWDMHKNAYRLANEKAGVFMGDFVRTAINTTINSGSIFGAFANVFTQSALTPKFIPPFSWGSEVNHKYEIEKLLLELERWMKMKGQTPSEELKSKIINLYNQF